VSKLSQGFFFGIRVVFIRLLSLFTISPDTQMTHGMTHTSFAGAHIAKNISIAQATVKYYEEFLTLLLMVEKLQYCSLRRYTSFGTSTFVYHGAFYGLEAYSLCTNLFTQNCAL